MEILNNIGNALTTENSVLLSYMIIFLAFIENFIGLILFTNLLSMKSSTNQKLLYVLSASVCSIITIFFIPTTYIAKYIKPIC